MLSEPTLLAQLIQSYARTAKLHKAKQLHAHLIISGAGTSSTFISNHLLNMYAKCGDLHHALSLFDVMPQRNLVTWTAMISGFSQNRHFHRALQTFTSMCCSGLKPTQFAFSSAIQASVSFGSLMFGKQLHSLSFKSGYSLELFVGSNLADMYSKLGSLADACKVFDEMPLKDEVSWNAMIDGYAKNGDFEQALAAFRSMFRENIVIDQHVLCSALSACGGLKSSEFGRSLQSVVVKFGFQKEIFICNALTDTYSKSGDMNSASRVAGLDSGTWNVVSCSSLIDGYVELEQIEKALSVYVESRRLGVEPNEFTFSSMVKACAGQAALEQGTQLHSQVIKTNFIEDSFVASALVDMYGKCGLLNSSILIFQEISKPTETAWNSILGVFAQHGRGKEAMEIFNQMVSRGISPNHVTFVSLLMACSHSGLVEEGLEYFNSMHGKYGMEPKEEHYSCVIDLLGRAGRLKEAEEFIGKMPFEPNAYGWCSLLGACRTHGDKALGELAAEKLIKLEPRNSGIHVLLSNIYGKLGQWEDVKAVRKLMRDNRVKKLPGFSWVDVNNKTHVFGAEDWSHPQMKDINEKLEELSVLIKEAGYVPFTGSLSCNVEERLKERLLNYHSERIAVAFALISMPKAKPIIVKKNLRVCVDCHTAIKLISKVVDREIIVRDNARFHHFSDGLCSCGDFW
ncbi:TPR-like protein [Dioscorea alata]|uniref:TPR-like protein n=1 Tax=Dioscorea alata TaxID=55571 RepID=A0ACB7VCW7_DIOAL|nr:TPR-like protein [Dioscorea alata]